MQHHVKFSKKLTNAYCDGNKLIKGLNDHTIMLNISTDFSLLTRTYIHYNHYKKIIIIIDSHVSKMS